MLPDKEILCISDAPSSASLYTRTFKIVLSPEEEARVTGSEGLNLINSTHATEDEGAITPLSFIP